MIKQGAKSAIMPLVLLLLAVHAVLLALIIGFRFLTAKMMVLMLLLAGAVLFLLGRRGPAKLSHTPAP